MSVNRNMDAILRDNQSLAFDSIQHAREWADATDLTPRARRAFERHLDRLEAKAGQAHVERSNKRAAVYKSEVEAHEQGIADDHREADEILVAVKSGRMLAREAKRRLRPLMNRYQERVKVQDHLKATAERWDAEVDAGPEAYAARMHERFPALGSGGVTIPAKVLRGEVTDDD